MAKKFKDYYDLECAHLHIDKISSVYPQFKSDAFLQHISDSYTDLEFMDRQDLFVAAFEQGFADLKYAEIVSVLTKILGPELETDTGMFTHGWWLWPVGRFIEKHGVEDVNASIGFIYELTKRFTGEFAIRPLLNTEPAKVLEVVEQWSRDENVHVRRLSSEGIRPRLPWSEKSTVFVDNPKECIEILTNLKDSPEKFVQKSVGNVINDLYKEKQELAEKIIALWSGGEMSKACAWIIKHGQRSLRKKK